MASAPSLFLVLTSAEASACIQGSMRQRNKETTPRHSRNKHCPIFRDTLDWLRLCVDFLSFPLCLILIDFLPVCPQHMLCPLTSLTASVSQGKGRHVLAIGAGSNCSTSNEIVPHRLRDPSSHSLVAGAVGGQGVLMELPVALLEEVCH